MPETIAEIIFPCPLRKSFDYLIPPDMNIKSGMRVIAPFGKRSAVGLVYSLKQHSDFDKNALKPISKVLDEVVAEPPQLYTK